MPLFAVRVGEPVATAVKKKAEEEGCTPSEIIRRCLATNIDNPGQYRLILDLNDQVRDLGYKVDVMRVGFSAVVETLTKGECKSNDLLRLLDTWEIIVKEIELHGISKVNELREFLMHELKEIKNKSK